LQPYRAVSALLTGAFLLIAGLGVVNLVTPLRAKIEGFPDIAIGLLGSFYFGGMLAGAFAAPFIIRRSGPVGAFAVYAIASGVIALVMPTFVSPLAWLALRAVMGFAFAGLYAVIEGWINATATNSNRGALYGFYQIVNFGASLAGQYVLTFESASSFSAFAIPAALFALAAAPLWLSKGEPPSVRPRTARVSLRWLARLSPVGVLAAFLVGAANGAHGSLAPIYALGVGFSPETAPWFTMAVSLGSALGVYPAGRLTDGRDRRKAMVAMASIGALVEVVLAMAPGGQTALVVLGFIGGLLTFTLYTLTASHANDHATADEVVLISSGLLFIYCIGAIAGPALAAVLMRAFGPGALYAQNAAAHLVLAAFAMAYLLKSPAATGMTKIAAAEVNP
jgi:MFS family permease